MATARGQQAVELCDSALRLDAEGRAAFLEEACAGDEGLRREVESLLAWEEPAERFLTSPALEILTAPGAAGEPERLPAGDVALKFLPPHALRDLVIAQDAPGPIAQEEQAHAGRPVRGQRGGQAQGVVWAFGRIRGVVDDSANTAVPTISPFGLIPGTAASTGASAGARAGSP